MTWGSKWLGRGEDRGQQHNLIVELYHDDQLTFRNFMSLSQIFRDRVPPDTWSTEADYLSITPDTRPEVGHNIKTSGHKRKVDLHPVHLQGNSVDYKLYHPSKRKKNIY